MNATDLTATVRQLERRLAVERAWRTTAELQLGTLNAKLRLALAATKAKTGKVPKPEAEAADGRAG